MCSRIVPGMIPIAESDDGVSTRMTSLDAIANLEPKLVWKYFCGLSAVPRPSKREGKIREHMKQVASKAGFEVREDACGNLVVNVPATEGCEQTPIIVLQAHLDMVCEKNSGTEHDFDKDPIKLILDEDPEKNNDPIVRADGTTLGADNGIGVAMAMAVATSPEVKHGPLELLFTLDEEDGMTGAKALTPESFRGRTMLNLDTEEDDYLLIGCAGGCDTVLTWSLALSPVDSGDEVVRVSVTGLRGGHSGCDIIENRGNAVKLLTQTLIRSGGESLRLASINAGSKRNAIPREAVALVCGREGLRDHLASAAEEIEKGGRDASGEPNLQIAIALDSATGAAGVAETATFLGALASCPSGVMGMSRKVSGLVETSNNLATAQGSISSDGKTISIEVANLSRSSSEVWRAAAAEQIASIGRLAGATVRHQNEYPGWDPQPDSKVLGICKGVYERLFGEAPHVEAIHAGLECGIIGQLVGNMDMVSLGPYILGAHSPDERVYVNSVARSWKLLVAVLDELSHTK